MSGNQENQVEQYILDKYGKQIKARSLELEGKTLTFPANFANFNSIFQDLPAFKARPDDVWLCSYPKSGCNWVNEMTVQVLQGRRSSSNKVHSMLEASTSIDDFDSLSSPRIMNTHVPWRYLPQQIKQSKIVYFLRNPLSVALSWFHHVNGLYTYDGTPEDFIESFCKEFYTFYGSWFSHVKEFYKASKQNTSIHLLFYEETKQNPHRSIAALSSFLSLSHTDEQIDKIVNETSLGSMRTHFKTHQEDKKAHIFIRKGEIAEWKNHVTNEFVEEFMRSYRAELINCPELLERIVI